MSRGGIVDSLKRRSFRSYIRSMTSIYAPIALLGAARGSTHSFIHSCNSSALNFCNNLEYITF